MTNPGVEGGQRCACPCVNKRTHPSTKNPFAPQAQATKSVKIRVRVQRTGMHACNCIPRHVQIATLKGAIFRAIDCCNYDELLTRSFALLAWEFSTLGYPRKFIGSAFGHVMSKYPYPHSRITTILQMLTC